MHQTPLDLFRNRKNGLVQVAIATPVVARERHRHETMTEGAPSSAGAHNDLVAGVVARLRNVHF